MQPRPKKSRLTAANPRNKIRSFLIDSMSSGTDLSNFPFFLGQVMNSDDPENGNRLQIRIPIIDDIFYTDENGKKADDSKYDSDLPWCMPSNNRFVNTPENNSVVLVALFNRNTPYNGRVWITAFEELSNLNVFDVDRLIRDSFDWDNAENVIETAYDNSPGLRNREAWKERSYKINYQVGIKGKDKNKLLFDKEKTILIQNEGTQNESKIELTSDIDMKAKKFSFLSSQSNEKFSPPFAEPLYDHIKKIQNSLNQIVNTLLLSPGTVAQAPVIANPNFSTIKTSLLQLDLELEQLKLAGQGKSAFTKIN